MNKQDDPLGFQDKSKTVCFLLGLLQIQNNNPGAVQYFSPTTGKLWHKGNRYQGCRIKRYEMSEITKNPNWLS